MSGEFCRREGDIRRLRAEFRRQDGGRVVPAGGAAAQSGPGNVARAERLANAVRRPAHIMPFPCNSRLFPPVALRLGPEWTSIDLNELTGPGCFRKYAHAPEKCGIGPEKRSGERSPNERATRIIEIFAVFPTYAR